jgi:hypothetical protein
MFSKEIIIAIGARMIAVDRNANHYNIFLVTSQGSVYGIIIFKL